MTSLNIPRLRLQNQQIAQTSFEKPGDLVAWLGAVQAQDYLGALWAVGLRIEHATEKDIEQAISERTIVRTWPMRGTLHFVAPADVRWMLKLLTPRFIARSRGQYHQAELDDTVFSRSCKILVKALQGGKRLPRNAVYKALETAHIPTTGQRGLHILGWLAQQGVICFGPREGKQQTFVLLDEWVPEDKTLERDEALAELARRYFTSHGPATLQDFGWWSGLTAADAKAGLEMAKSQFIQAVIDGQTYWLPSSLPTLKDHSPTAHLLPAYDEYTVAYKDRSAVLDPAAAKHSGNGIFSPIIVADGQIVGTWKRTFKKDTVFIETSLFTPLSKARSRALSAAAHRFGRFAGMTSTIPV